MKRSTKRNLSLIPKNTETQRVINLCNKLNTEKALGILPKDRGFYDVVINKDGKYIPAIYKAHV